jgi:hypothetical protein
MRELSEFEAVKFQGFPNGFTFGNQRRSLTLKQIGNAVHPGTARLVFQALIERAKELGLDWAEDFIAPSKKIKNFPSNLTQLYRNT